MSSSESKELSPSNSAQNDVEPTQPELLSKSVHESSDDDASGDESAPRASSPKSEMEEEYSSSEDELMPDNKFSDEEVRVAYEDLEETPQVSSENETRDSETPQVSEKPQARVEFDTSNSCNRRPEEKQANKRPRNPSSPTQNPELKKAKDLDAMQRSIDEMIARLHQSEIARKQDQQAYGQQIDRLMEELQKLNAINAQKDEENRGLVSRLMSLTQGPKASPEPTHDIASTNAKIEELIMNLQNSEAIRQRERERHGRETAEMMAELKQLRATIEQKDLRNQELVDQLMRLTAEKQGQTPTPSDEVPIEVVMETEEGTESGNDGVYEFPKYRKRKNKKTTSQISQNARNNDMSEILSEASDAEKDHESNNRKKRRTQPATVKNTKPAEVAQPFLSKVLRDIYRVNIRIFLYHCPSDIPTTVGHTPEQYLTQGSGIFLKESSACLK
ncbi:uncharacterized protein LOC126893132 [Diabrotica virgifera virgifera]|uniref:Uncharacterized protein n=1 Tax=Diabrotica virgifera virgifera TaxID=50390 RepID=A0ABM5L9C0_DIAVI|nr:uncharacterized protein LOC126893132 [Diabrotica virgifera virgifera]